MSLVGTAQIGDRVSFRIADVYLPEPQEVLAKRLEEVRAGRYNHGAKSLTLSALVDLYLGSKTRIRACTLADYRLGSERPDGRADQQLR